MDDQEFNELLKEIETEEFTELNIDGENENGEKGEESFDDKKIVLLTNVIKKNPSVIKIDLSMNNIGDIGAVALSSIKTLEDLNLYRNNVGPIGAMALASSRLKKLSLSTNPIIFNNKTEYISFSEVLEIANAFINNKTILNLDLSGCKLSDKIIPQLIYKNTSIKILDLSNNDLTDDALQYIEENKSLETLYLSQDQITDKGIEYITKNMSLKVLHLNQIKNITDQSAKYLSTHCTLKELSLISTSITIEGLKHFISSNLEDIYSFSHSIPHEEFMMFYKFFKEEREAKNEISKSLLSTIETELNYSENSNYINLSGDMEQNNDS